MKKIQSKTVKYTVPQLKKMKNKSKTNFSKVDALSDNDIDYSDLPALDDQFWMKAKVVDNTKKPISLRIDTDVLDWYKHQKGRYQKLMNMVLRQYMVAHQHHR